MKLEVIMMDITKIGKKADAIVNAANETLLGGGGVDGAIHRAAGPELLKECLTLHGCKPGEAKVTKAYNLDNKYIIEAKVTKAYNLDNKYIIHTVGPIYYSNPYPKETLENCYKNCLRIADELGLESIAFPSISTGVYGYPVEEASEIAVKTICSFKPKNLKIAYMCIYFDEDDMSAYNNALTKYNL